MFFVLFNGGPFWGREDREGWVTNYSRLSATGPHPDARLPKYASSKCNVEPGLKMFFKPGSKLNLEPVRLQNGFWARFQMNLEPVRLENWFRARPARKLVWGLARNQFRARAGTKWVLEPELAPNDVWNLAGNPFSGLASNCISSFYFSTYNNVRQW